MTSMNWNETLDRILHSLGKTLPVAEARAMILDQALPESAFSQLGIERTKLLEALPSKLNGLQALFLEAEQIVEKADALFEIEEQSLRDFVTAAENTRTQLATWT